MINTSTAVIVSIRLPDIEVDRPLDKNKAGDGRFAVDRNKYSTIGLTVVCLWAFLKNHIMV